MLAYTGSAGAAVALKLLKERADSAEALAAAATRQVADLKSSLQVDSKWICGFRASNMSLPFGLLKPHCVCLLTDGID